MPTRNEYKAAIRSTLGLKEKSDFSEQEQKRYEELNKEFVGPNWKEKFDSRVAENAEIIQHLESTQNMMREEHLRHLPEYRRRKEEEYRQKSKEAAEQVEQLRKKLDSKEYTEEQHKVYYTLWHDLRDRVEDYNTLADFARDGSGNHSIGDVGAVYLMDPPDDAFRIHDENRVRLIQQQRDLKTYEKMRNALGRDKSDLDPKKVDDAVEKYRTAKGAFDKLNGWQRFWGSVLPASWYKPAEQYLEMKAYEEALNEVHIDGNAVPAPDPVAAPAPAPDSSSREPFGVEEQEKLRNETSLEQDASPLNTKDLSSTEKSPELGANTK